MPEICPEPSTLTPWRIGGQIDRFCADDTREFPDIRVTVSLVGASRVQDPTSNGFLNFGDPLFTTTYIGGSDITGDGFDDADGPVANDSTTDGNPTSDGCWCTCELKPTTATDPNNALQPSGLRYKVVVATRNAAGAFTTIISEEVEIDGERDYEAEGLTIDTPCGPAINIIYLLDVLPTVPPLGAFCAAVYGCLTNPITGTGLLAGGVSGSYENGWTINLAAATVTDLFPQPTSPNATVTIGGTLSTGLTLQVPDTVVTSDGDTTGVTQSGVGGRTIDVQVTSTDSGQLLGVGSDGGSLLRCTSLNSCFSQTVDANTGETTFNYPGGSFTAPGGNSITTDGTSVGVSQTSTGGVTTTNLVLRSTNADQILTTGTDGGTLLTCAAVLDCIHISQAFAGGAAQIPGSGTASDPWVIPAETALSVLTNGSATGVAQSGVSSHSVDIRTISTQAGNVITEGLDGGAFIDCATIRTCLPDITGSGDVTVTGDWATGWNVAYTDTPTTLQSVTVVDNGDETSTITITDSTGASVSDTYPTPDDVFITGAAFSGPDASGIVTLDIDVSDGTAFAPTFTLPASTVDTFIQPQLISIDPALGQIVFTYLDENGAPQTLVDNVTPFADTNTTNSTFTYDPLTGTATITDSDGNPLSITIPVAGNLTFDAVTNDLIVDNGAAATVPLDQTLDIGAGHIGAGTVGVSVIESQPAGTGIAGVTTFHDKALIAAINGTIEAGAAGAIVSGVNNELNGPNNVSSWFVSGDANTVSATGQNSRTGFVTGAQNTVDNSGRIIVGGNSNIIDDSQASIVSGNSNQLVQVQRSIVSGQMHDLTDAALVSNSLIIGDSIVQTGQVDDSMISGRNNSVEGVAILVSGRDHTITSDESAIVGGIGAVVSDPQAVSLAGGHATTGTAETLAHGTPGGPDGAALITAATPVGFRGAVPQPARTVATLSDLMTALAEQGLILEDPAANGLIVGRVRDSVHDENPYDAATALAASPAVTPLAVTAGDLNEVWVAADASALTADVTLDVLVDGAVVGSVAITAGAQFGPTATGITAAVAAGSTATFALQGDGTGTVSDIVVTYDWTE